MRDLNELKKNQEDDRLFWAVMNVKEECPSIYQEFGLAPQLTLTCLEFLITAYKEHHWLEVIDWATTLAQNVRFDLLENGININTMNSLMSSLLELINIATTKQCRELRGSR